jgi:hypothetical protein
MLSDPPTGRGQLAAHHYMEEISPFKIQPPNCPPKRVIPRARRTRHRAARRHRHGV